MRIKIYQLDGDKDKKVVLHYLARKLTESEKA